MIRQRLSRSIAPALVAALFVLAGQTAVARTAPVPHGAVRASKVFGWQTMPNSRMILWLGVSEPWLLTLEAPCAAPWHNPRWVSMHDGHIVPGTDTVGNGEQSCRILHITQIPAAERTALGLHAPVGGPLEWHRHNSKHAQ